MGKELIPPVQKGDILTLGAVSIGANGDLMFRKGRYRLFLKNPKKKAVAIGQQIKLKVVKVFKRDPNNSKFGKVGYVELV